MWIEVATTYEQSPRANFFLIGIPHSFYEPIHPTFRFVRKTMSLVFANFLKTQENIVKIYEDSRIDFLRHAPPL